MVHESITIETKRSKSEFRSLWLGNPEPNIPDVLQIVNQLS